MKRPGDLEKSFRAAAKETEALNISGGGWMNGQRARVADQAAKTRLPVIYPNSQFVLVGRLMSYGADFLDQHRRMAYYGQNLEGSQACRSAGRAADEV
jgi:hypothetical protein